MLKKKLNKKGFSLVELIVVIAIMAILAAVIIPTVTNKIKDANNGSANTTASTIANDIKAEAIAIISGVPGDLVYLKVDENNKSTVGGLKDTKPTIEGFDADKEVFWKADIGDEGVSIQYTAGTAASEGTPATPAKVTVKCKVANSAVQVYEVTIDATTATVEKTAG